MLIGGHLHGESEQMGDALSRSLPKVLLVGGPDVDARLDLMNRLRGTFDVAALGSTPILENQFFAEGYQYDSYHMSRRIDPISDFVTFGELLLKFRNLRPLIVHAFDRKPGVWGCLAARVAGVPIVIGTLPGLGSLYGNRGLKARTIKSIYERLQMLACRVSDLTIFQNGDDACQFASAGVVSRRKAVVIPGSGVATEALSAFRVSDAERNQVRVELRIEPREIVVTMISRVIRSKGVLEFMAAAKEVACRRRSVRFLLVGPHDDDSIDQLTPEELSQLERAIEWRGPRRDIPVVLAVSDIFVFPSAYREGIPRVLLEAASMGLPIVTTDTPGCRDVVKHGDNGLLVPAGDTGSLVQAILSLVDDPEMRSQYGLASRNRAVSHFDLSLIAEQIRLTYLRALAAKGFIPN